MENISPRDNRNQNNENIFETILNIERKYENSYSDIASYGLTAEAGKNFFRYLKKFNLHKDPDLLILPPNNHYYFDEKELKSVKTVINLKNLNLVKELDSFLFTLIGLLPANANFIGCFSYNKLTFTRDGLLWGLSTKFTNLLDSRTDHNLNDREFSERLERAGFRVVDMTEMDNLTYFYSQNIRKNSVLHS